MSESEDDFFGNKEQYLKAEMEVYEYESNKEDTLIEDTWGAIKLLFKSCLPNFNS